MFDATHFDLVGTTYSITATGSYVNTSLTPQVQAPTDGDPASLQQSGMLAFQQATLDRDEWLAQHFAKPIVLTFNSTTTWVCPAGVRSVDVTIWGGGGGAAGGYGGVTGVNAAAVGGGGGAASQRSRQTFTPVVGRTYNITIGAGGIGAIGGVAGSGSGAGGGDGGTSSVEDTVTTTNVANGIGGSGAGNGNAALDLGIATGNLGIHFPGMGPAGLSVIKPDGVSAIEAARILIPWAPGMGGPGTACAVVASQPVYTGCESLEGNSAGNIGSYGANDGGSTSAGTFGGGPGGPGGGGPGGYGGAAGNGGAGSAAGTGSNGSNGTAPAANSGAGGGGGGAGGAGGVSGGNGGAGAAGGSGCVILQYLMYGPVAL